MIRIPSVVVLLATSLLSLPVWACSLAPSHPWNADPDKLVRSTQVILVVQAVRATSSDSNVQSREGGSKARDLHFKVLQVLKGSFAETSFTLKRVLPAPKKEDLAPLKEAAARTDPEFARSFEDVLNAELPIVGLGDDCRLFISGIEIGGKYLVFVDSIHPKGYRRIDSNQAWLEQVKNLISEDATRAQSKRGSK